MCGGVGCCKGRVLSGIAVSGENALSLTEKNLSH